ncbi:hypothetical protein AVDCRST_MAG82-3388, partial [uncultured Rubrobacteraceae bacterium]
DRTDPTRRSEREAEARAPRRGLLGQLRRDAQGRWRGRGRDEHQRRRPQGRRTLAGLREDVAEDLQGQPRGRRGYTRRGHQDLEDPLHGLLARGQPLLRAGRRHRPRRGRPHQRLAARRRQALDGCDGPLRRRRVLLPDDARGASFLGLDHLQLLRGGGRHRSPGPGPDAGQRPPLRGGPPHGRPQDGGRDVAQDPGEPGGPLRRSRARRDERGLRRPQAAVEPVQKRLAQRGYTLRDTHDHDPPPLAPHRINAL